MVITQLIVMVMEIEDDTGIDMNLMICTVIIIQDTTTVVFPLTGMIIMATEEGTAEDMAMEWTIAMEMEFMDVATIIMVTIPAVDIRMRDHAMDMDVMVDMRMRDHAMDM